MVYCRFRKCRLGFQPNKNLFEKQMLMPVVFGGYATPKTLMLMLFTHYLAYPTQFLKFYN